MTELIIITNNNIETEDEARTTELEIIWEIICKNKYKIQDQKKLFYSMNK